MSKQDKNALFEDLHPQKLAMREIERAIDIMRLSMKQEQEKLLLEISSKINMNITAILNSQFRLFFDNLNQFHKEKEVNELNKYSKQLINIIYGKMGNPYSDTDNNV